MTKYTNYKSKSECDSSSQAHIVQISEVASERILSQGSDVKVQSRHLGPRAGWELLHGHHHHPGHHPPHHGSIFASHTRTLGWELLI